MAQTDPSTQSPFATLDQSSPFGAKPQQLDQPEPGAQDQQDLAQSIASDAQPEIPSPQGPEGSEGLVESPTMGLEQQLSPDELEAQEFLEQFSPKPEAEPSRAEQDPNSSIEGIIKQVKEFPLRFKTSFGVTVDSKLESIQESVGKENATKTKEGKLRFRKDKDSPWMDFDNDEVEFLNDIFADGARNIVEGLVENTFRITGGIGGAGTGAVVEGAAGAATGTVVAPGPGTLIGGTAGAVKGGALGGIAGASAGGALGSVAALNVGDFIQENIFGISRDPKRPDKVTEAKQAAVFGAGFNLLASSAVRVGSKARALIKPNRKILPEDLSPRVSEAMDSIEELKQSGLSRFREVDGTEIYLARNQLDPTDPGLKLEAKQIASHPGFKKFIENQGNMLKNTYLEIADAAGNISSKKLGLGKRFTNSVKDIDTIESSLIGSFRDAAEVNSKGAKYNVANFGNNLKAMAGELGLEASVVTSKGGKQSIKLIGDIDAPELDAGQAKRLTAKLEEMGTLLLNNGGELDLKTIHKHYRGLTKNINDLDRGITNVNLKHKFVDIKNSLRDDYTNSIGEFLPEGPGGKAAYQTSLDRLSSLRNSSKSINSLLKTENMSKEALSKSLFSGKTSLEDIDAVKNIIMQDDPTLWRDLTGEFMDGLIRNNTDSVSKQVNWKQVRNGLFGKSGVGEEVVDRMFEGTKVGKKELQALFNLGEFVNASNVKPDAAPAVVNKMRALIELSLPMFITSKVDRVVGLVGGLGKDKAFAKYISKNGVGELTKGIKHKEISKVRRILMQAAIISTGVGQTAGRKQQQEEAILGSGGELAQ